MPSPRIRIELTVSDAIGPEGVLVTSTLSVLALPPVVDRVWYVPRARMLPEAYVASA